MIEVKFLYGDICIMYSLVDTKKLLACGSATWGACLILYVRKTVGSLNVTSNPQSALTKSNSNPCFEQQRKTNFRVFDKNALGYS